MPHTVKITKELDGDRYLILRVFIRGDGASPDLSGYTLMDPTSTIIPTKPAKPFASIDELWFDIDGFNMRLDFDDVNDPPTWTISQGAGNYIDFRSIGGLIDRSGIDGTGKLLLSTIGLDSASKQATLLIKIRK